jgi:hypothetical protein
MADSRPIHGKNGYLYIGGVALAGSNAWEISISTDSVETETFGDGWKQNVAGMSAASGSITAWQWANRRTLIDAVTGQTALSTYIYPDRLDATNYFSGSFVFTGYTGNGSTAAAVAGNATFVVDGTLTATGFA